MSWVLTQSFPYLPLYFLQQWMCKHPYIADQKGNDTLWIPGSSIFCSTLCFRFPLTDSCHYSSLIFQVLSIPIDLICHNLFICTIYEYLCHFQCFCYSKHHCWKWFCASVWEHTWYITSRTAGSWDMQTGCPKRLLQSLLTQTKFENAHCLHPHQSWELSYFHILGECETASHGDFTLYLLTY